MAIYEKGYLYASNLLKKDERLCEMQQGGVMDWDKIYDSLADAYVQGMMDKQDELEPK